VKRKVENNIQFIKSGHQPKNRLLIVTATLGIVRVEWAGARFGQVIPCNWSLGQQWYGPNMVIPMSYLVADAQNVGVQCAIEGDYEFLFLHEDDVILPPDCFLKLNEYMRKADVPIVSGLYYTKSQPAEPVLYRGSGTSYFADWKMGDKVWVDGCPTGCLLIHRSILDIVHKEAPEYKTIDGVTRKQVFVTAAEVFMDPQTKQYSAACGTSDLVFCKNVIKNNVLAKAGWKKLAKKQYPFLVDTTLYCGHIDLTSGRVFPLR
jgi:hypothetical protein